MTAQAGNIPGGAAIRRGRCSVQPTLVALRLPLSETSAWLAFAGWAVGLLPG